jgi:elongation factor Ts
MNILDAVKDLRFKTSAGMMECKEALKESNGDVGKAIEILRKKGIAKAAKKTDRVAGQGIIESYVHTGDRMGVLLEINCETDFVARTDDFRKLSKDIAMQVAAAHPLYVDRSEVPEECLEKEREIAMAQIKDKPKEVSEKIVQGKLEKYYSETCLLEQPYIKDPAIRVKDLLTQAIAKTGENIVLKRFARFEIGESC